MTIRLYLDHQVPRPIAVQLRRRGVYLVTAEEDGTTRFPDPELLDRAAQLGRILVSEDKDFLAEVTSRQRNDVRFLGVLFVPSGLSIGQRVNALNDAAEVLTPEDMADRLERIKRPPFS